MQIADKISETPTSLHSVISLALNYIYVEPQGHCALSVDAYLTCDSKIIIQTVICHGSG